MLVPSIAAGSSVPCSQEGVYIIIVRNIASDLVQGYQITGGYHFTSRFALALVM